ncbi:hypothetical protein [Tunturiibacter gelidiferens]|uniref:hypothetical protein n=1 Tax=Tunturiibacter gelidiferens TaxID=3069689 RepID=UPI003D9B5245
MLAFGRGPYSTDAQHVSVEFVHPVIVGKRALPALDLSALMRPWIDAILRSEDIVMGFGPPEGDPEVWEALASAEARGAMTFALPGPNGFYALKAVTQDPFIHQELVEVFITPYGRRFTSFWNIASWVRMWVKQNFSILSWARKNRRLRASSMMSLLPSK